MTREWWWLKGAATRWTKKKKSNFPNQKVISHTTHPLSCPFPSNSDSLSCFPPAELLSACHELRCRYGCVMTRNGTFCFCADGFEVGEDGTSCRGRIQLRCGSSGGGPGSCHGALLPTSPFALSQTSIRWTSRRCWVYENHLSADRASCTVHYMEIQDTVCLWLVLTFFPLLGCIYTSIVLLQLQFWGTWTSLEYFHLPLYYSLEAHIQLLTPLYLFDTLTASYYAECIRAEEQRV